MTLTLITSTPDTRRLILIFAGWAMDERPFEGLSFEGYDIGVAYDYRDADPSEAATFASRYEEIVVIAWSFGVVAAERFLAEADGLPVTATIAVNGTPEAVDASLGIPEPLFEATLNALSPASLQKFYRRAGLGTSPLPERDFTTLAAELIAVRGLRGRRGVRWDKALIGSADRIIPPANQAASWQPEPTEVMHLDGTGHFPDFQSILDVHLCSKPLVAARFEAALPTYDAAATAQQAIARRAVEMLPDVRRADIIEIGCGSGLSTRLLLDRLPDARVTAVDLYPCPSLDGVNTVTADGELYLRSRPEESADIVVSVSAMQWFNSPVSFLREARRVLRPGGTAVVTTFGPSTMEQLRQAGLAGRHYPTAATLRRQFEAQGWKSVELSDDSITLSFPTARDVMLHIRHTGVNAISVRNSGGQLRRLLESYPLEHDGSARLTYQPIYIKCRK